MIKIVHIVQRIILIWLLIHSTVLLTMSDVNLFGRGSCLQQAFTFLADEQWVALSLPSLGLFHELFYALVVE